MSQFKHDPNGRCRYKECYEVLGSWLCEYVKISDAPCIPVPEGAVTKTIGLGPCPDCGHKAGCWLHYLRWEVDHDITLNQASHHLVLPNIDPPLQISPEQYAEALDYLRRLVQYLTKHGGYMSTKYQAALRGARALLKEQDGA